MSNMFDFFEKFHITDILSAVFLMALGYIIARLASSGITRLSKNRFTPQQAMLAQRFIYYTILILFFISAIQQLGFRISAILGATGIITVAIGIASQASLSNIISGLFILAEKPFEIGNTIKVNDIEGEVVSIDLLSVKIRTGENMLVRIPNESLVKSAITNLSYFPNRRIDFSISLALKEDLSKVKKTLFSIAEKNHLCLKVPEPVFLVKGFGDYAISIQFSVWAMNSDINGVKNNFLNEIKTAFSVAEIETPSTANSLISSLKLNTLPIKVV